jgi:hypothetical protein
MATVAQLGILCDNRLTGGRGGGSYGDPVRGRVENEQTYLTNYTRESGHGQQTAKMRIHTGSSFKRQGPFGPVDFYAVTGTFFTE